MPSDRTRRRHFWPRADFSLSRDERGVSEVIGNILLVALSVVMLGAFGALVLSTVSSDTPTPPASTFSIEPTAGSTFLDVRLVSGSMLTLSDTTILLQQNGTNALETATVVSQAIAGKWSPGETLRVDLPGAATLETTARLLFMAVDGISGQTVGMAYATVPGALTGTTILRNTVSASLAFDRAPLTTDGSNLVNATIDVSSSLGILLIDSVTLNLSTVGGESALVLHDDGVAPDEIANDGRFTTAFTVDNHTYTSLPGFANLSIPALVRDVLGNTTTTSATLYLASPPVSKVGYGTEFRNIGSSGIISTTGFINLTAFTFRDAAAVNSDQVEVRVSDLQDPSKAWSALVSFSSTGCSEPSVTSIVLRRDGVAGNVTYTPADGCFGLDTDARLNLANIPNSLNLDLAAETWNAAGTAATYQYAAAGIGTSNEAIIAFFGDATSLSPFATGLGQADLQWSPPGTNSVPSAITTLAGTPGAGFVDLSWTAPSNGGTAITAYKIYRDGVLIDTIGTNTTYRAAGLTNGQSYAFKVVAVNAVGDSPDSNVVNATPIAVATVPTSFTAQPAIGRAYLNWSAPTSDGGSPITAYRIYLNGTLHATIGTNTSFIALGLEHNSTYNWQVSAVNANGEGPKTTSTPATTPGIPYPPQPFTAEPALNRVYLNWTAPANDGGTPVTSYQIHRNGTLYDTVGTNTTYVALGLGTNSTYDWRIVAVNGVGGSTPTPITSATTPGVTDPPASLAATPASGQVSLSWSAPADTNGRAVTAYKIYRDGVLIDTIGTNTSYVAAGLTNGQSYTFNVVALNEVGDSNAASVSATPATSASAPQTLTAQAAIGRVYLNWTAPSSDGGSPITSYRIFLNGTLHATIGTNTSFIALGLEHNTTYDWEIAAVTANGEGVHTASTPATTPGVPYPPIGLSATAGNAQVTLSWSPPSSTGGSAVTNYRIYVDGVLRNTIGTNTSYVVAGLTNGQSYTFSVRAVNGVGEGTGATASATPSLASVAPSAPTSFTVAATNRTAFLNWSAPVSDGGTPITGYRIHRNGSFIQQIGTNTSYVAAGLLNNVSYSFSVSAVNLVGESPMAGPLTGTPGAIPYPPGSLAASAGNRSVALTWTLPPNDGGRALTSYTIYNASSGGVIATTTNGANTSFTVNGLTNGTLYQFRITASNSLGESAVSNTVGATPSGASYPPTSLAATSSNASIALSWTLPINNGGSALTGFRIVNASSGATIATTTNGANTSFTVNSLANGFAYTFYVAALNANGASSGSNTASTTPASVPFPPSGLTATNATGQVSLSWSAPTNNGGSAITGYQIYRNGTLLASIGTNTTFVDAAGIPGVSYAYTIRAVNAVGTSSASNSAAGTSTAPASPPGAPQNMILTGANGRVILTWSAPSSDGGSPVTGYRIYRSTTNDTGSMALVTTIGTNTSYVDMGRTNGVTYYYQIRAVNAVGDGTLTSIKDATPAVFISVNCASYTLTTGNALTPSCIPLQANDSTTTEFREPGGSNKEFNLTMTMNTTGLSGAFTLQFRGYRENGGEGLSLYALNVTSGAYDLIGTIASSDTSLVVRQSTVYSTHHWPAGILTIRFKDPGPDSNLSSWEIDHVGLVT